VAYKIKHWCRRRGKNKVAAQNCRRRKIDQIDELTKKIGKTSGPFLQVQLNVKF